jgi:DNA-binding response OmpR family regulator
MTEQQKRSVLVIDDDVQLQSLIRVVLCRAGFEVHQVFDGRAALEKIANDDYDALLLDLMMPEVNGFEVLAAMRAARPELLKRTVVCTAVTDSVLQSLDQDEVGRVIRKPFDIHALTSALSDCCLAPRSVSEPPPIGRRTPTP